MEWNTQSANEAFAIFNRGTNAIPFEYRSRVEEDSELGTVITFTILDGFECQFFVTEGELHVYSFHDDDQQYITDVNTPEDVAAAIKQHFADLFGGHQ